MNARISVVLLLMLAPAPMLPPQQKKADKPAQ